MMDVVYAGGTARLSIAVGAVAVGTVGCLATYFAVGGPFGTINDVGNAATGILSALLAWRLRAHVPGRTGEVALCAAVGGAALTVAGSALVVSGTTGFFLAGLVSALGYAGIGGWLLLLNRSGRWASLQPRMVRRVGLVAGALMALGLVSVPGILLRLDDMATAPAWVWIGFLSWLGTYVAYPLWAVWLGARGVGVAVRPGLAPAATAGTE